MGELYEPFPKLPKNFRQIGGEGPGFKIISGRYVNTYLKRLQPAKGLICVWVCFWEAGRPMRTYPLFLWMEPWKWIQSPRKAEKWLSPRMPGKRPTRMWSRCFPNARSRDGFSAQDRLYLKPSDLLEAAQSVFYGKEPAHVSELRSGGRGSCLHNIL